MLGKAVDEIVMHEGGKVIGVRSGDEIVHCKQVSVACVKWFG